MEFFGIFYRTIFHVYISDMKGFRMGIYHVSFHRDQHLYNTDPLYLPEEKAFVTETQVIRETLW